MTKLQGRAIMRGKKLDSYCYKSKAIYYEYGPNDKRVFCWGLNDARTDEPIKECEQCKAFVYNAKPLDEEEEEWQRN